MSLSDFRIFAGAEMNEITSTYRNMKNVAEPKEYKSPLRKLMNVFRDGREQWKEKCAQSRRQIKTLKNRIKRLENSKTELTNEVKNLQEEVGFLNAQLRRASYEHSRLEFEEAKKRHHSKGQFNSSDGLRASSSTT